MKFCTVAVIASTLISFGTTVLGQPKNHIGEPLAQVLVGHGCTLSDADVAEALRLKGYGISDLQAQVNALLHGRYLGSTADGKWKLQNWPPCQ